MNRSMDDFRKYATKHLGINSLVLDAWDHRGAQTDIVQFSENKELRRLINHLQLTEPVPKSGTGSGMGG